LHHGEIIAAAAAIRTNNRQKAPRHFVNSSLRHLPLRRAFSRVRNVYCRLPGMDLLL